MYQLIIIIWLVESEINKLKRMRGYHNVVKIQWEPRLPAVNDN